MKVQGSIIAVLFFAISTSAFADTLILKNGRKIDGVVQRDDEQGVSLEVQAGTISFSRSEVERIERADAFTHNQLRQKWHDQKQDLNNRVQLRNMAEERKPKEVQFSGQGNSVVVSARLNGRCDAKMLLDTGASILMIRRTIAEELGFDLDHMKPDMEVRVADGRSVPAKHVVLESVEVQGAKAYNIDASILMQETGDAGMGDGLLGMSFLKNFKFKIDYADRKLVLEKR